MASLGFLRSSFHPNRDPCTPSSQWQLELMSPCCSFNVRQPAQKEGKFCLGLQCVPNNSRSCTFWERYMLLPFMQMSQVDSHARIKQTTAKKCVGCVRKGINFKNHAKEIMRVTTCGNI